MQIASPPEADEDETIYPVFTQEPVPIDEELSISFSPETEKDVPKSPIIEPDNDPSVTTTAVAHSSKSSEEGHLKSSNPNVPASDDPQVNTTLIKEDSIMQNVLESLRLTLKDRNDEIRKIRSDLQLHQKAKKDLEES